MIKRTLLLGMVAFGVCSMSDAQVSTLKERQAKAKKIAALYQEAETAYDNGENEKAKKALEKLLKLHPRHGNGRALYYKVKNGGPRAIIIKRQKAMEEVLIPVLDLNDATVEEALEILSTQIETASKDAVVPNFVIQDTQQKFKGKKVNLTLKKIPASAALQFIMDSVNGSATYEKYTISIKPQ